jgi:hypothetical protein
MNELCLVTPFGLLFGGLRYRKLAMWQFYKMLQHQKFRETLVLRQFNLNEVPLKLEGDVYSLEKVERTKELCNI